MLSKSSSGSNAPSDYTSHQFNQYIILFEGNALACMLTGVYLAITGVNLYLLRRRTTYNILSLYSVVQLTFVALYTALALYTVPGRTLAIFGISNPDSTYLVPDTLSTWPAIVVDAALVSNTCISDAFLLYRCYHITRLQDRYALIFPALLYLATVGSSLAFLIANSIPGAVYGSHAVQLAGVCYWTLSTAMNVCASCIISVRLWTYRRAICNIHGSQHGAFYLDYIAMTLESALLYTVFAIITLIVFTLNSPLEFMFIPMVGVIQAIAPSLIIYRIARGISFEVDQHGSITIGSIHFASPSNRTRTMLQGEALDAIGTIPGSSSDNTTKEEHSHGPGHFIREIKHEA